MTCICAVLVLLLLVGCTAQNTALTPENLLDRAFGKSRADFEAAFSLDLEADAEVPDPDDPDSYYIEKPLKLHGRTVDRLYLSFPDDKLNGFTYTYAFDDFLSAFDFALIAAEDAEKQYGASILEEITGDVESIPRFTDSDRENIRLKWEKSDEPIHFTKDIFAVKESCTLEITLTSFENEGYLVTLGYWDGKYKE